MIRVPHVENVSLDGLFSGLLTRQVIAADLLCS
jgi:hypothetical protein